MNKNIKSVLTTIFVASVSAVITLWGYQKYVSPREQVVQVTQPVNAVQTAAAVVPAITTDFTKAAESTVNAVVHVNVKVNYTSPYIDIWDLLRGNAPQERVMEGSGSGVIISADGYIVTNNHVIDKSNNIEVVLNDKRRYDARLVGTDPSTDIALLKVEADNLPYIPFGSSDDLKLGEWVLAVGNPFNLSTTVTAGIVSAKGRGIGILGDNSRLGIESFIQTDAAVNRGNSGGALVNTRGELVGVNSAIASPTGAYAGYSFAVPVTIVKKVVGDIMEFGSVQRAFLGITMNDIDAKFAQSEGLKDLKGVYINGVAEGGGAKAAGIREKDVLVAINGVNVNSGSELLEQMSKYRPGDKVTVDYIRNKERKSSLVTLKNQQGTTSITRNDKLTALGATFDAVDKNELTRLGLSNGIQIKSVNAGKFSNYGIREGYIITKVNDKPIYSADDLKTAIEGAKGGLFITGVYPNGKKAYYAINLEE
jgi:serine protease Do